MQLILQIEDDEIRSGDAASMAQFLNVLCGLLSDTSHVRGAGIDEVRMVARRLISLHVPVLALQMAALTEDEPASRGMQLCLCLLEASKPENEVLTEDDRLNHPQSQREFLRYLDELVGRHAIQSFQRRLQEEADFLTNEDDNENEDEDEVTDISQDDIIRERRTSAYVVSQILIMIRLCTRACFVEAQTFFLRNKVTSKWH
jgi:hypothetical protein